MNSRKHILIALSDRKLGKLINSALHKAGYHTNYLDNLQVLDTALRDIQMACFVYSSDIKSNIFTSEIWGQLPAVAIISKGSPINWDCIYDPPIHEYETTPLDLEHLIVLIKRVANI